MSKFCTFELRFWSLFIGLSLSFSAWAQTPEERTLQLLAKEPVVRVVMRDARYGSRSGHGHQAANALLIKRLREIGYEGKIELLYDVEIKAKLEFLLPPFRADGPDTQEIAGLNVTAITYGEVPSTKVKLAVAAADDQETTPQNVNAEKLIVIQPPGLKEDAVLRTANTGDGIGPYIETPLKSVTQAHPAIYSIPKPASIPDFLKLQMDHSDSLRPRIPAVATLIHSAREKKVEVLSAYGLGYNGTVKFANLVRAIELSRSSLKAGTVIALLSNFNAKEWAEIQALTGPLAVVDAADKDAPARMSALKKNETLILKMGNLSQDVWNLVFDLSTLPPTVAGTSSLNLAILRGRPFIQTTPTLTSKNIADHSEESRELLAVVEQTSEYLADAAGAAPLAKFFAESLKVQSKLAQLFDRYAARVRKTSDRVCEAILANETPPE